MPNSYLQMSEVSELNLFTISDLLAEVVPPSNFMYLYLYFSQTVANKSRV